MTAPARTPDPRRQARVVCLITPDLARPGYVSIVWSQGPDAFPPLSFDLQLVGKLQKVAGTVRQRLGELVQSYLDALGTPDPAAHPDVRQAGLALAEAGYDLRTRLFRAAEDIAGWLGQLHARGEVESLEVIADDQTIDIPWNLVYEVPPDKEAFLNAAAAGDQWQPFWGLRYNVAGGQRVDPRRRMALPPDPRVLLVVDELVLEGLRQNSDSETRRKAAALEKLRSRPGLEWITSRSELQKRLRSGRPDILYWLGHTSDKSGWLVLEDGEVEPQDLRDWLEGDKPQPPSGVVFLNACRTAGATAGGGSFVDAVLKSKMGGVIATEHVVLDTFANPFGLNFLEQFLDGGRSIGDILRELRGRVPLGLLYGTYCPPELRISRPEEAAAGAAKVSINAMAPPDGRSLRIVGPASARSELPERPYPSLNYYDRGDRALFAGRDDDIVRFAHILDDDATRLLILHGESGSGKSSFLRAGVVPYLEDVCVGYQFARDRSRKDGDPVLFVRATDDLPGQMADALATFASRPLAICLPSGGENLAGLPTALSGATGGMKDAAGVLAALTADPAAFGRALAALAACLPFRLVLVIDQAEEVFTLGHARAHGQQASALALLREAAALNGDFKIIVALRTEYYGRLVDHLRSGVRAAVGIRDYLLTDLNEAALAEAIRRPTLKCDIPNANTQPHAKYNFEFATGMVETLSRRLMAYTTGNQDSVQPLAQVICGQLYDRVNKRTDARVIREADLVAIGGVEGGMKRHAEGLVEKLFPSPRDRHAFRQLMSGLYRQQSDGTLTTDLVPEAVLAERWKGKEELAEVLKKATGGEWRLLRKIPRRIGGVERTDISLGHDALARVAADWNADATRWRRWRRMATVVSGVSVIAVAMAGLAMLAWDLRERAVKQKEIAEEQAKVAIAARSKTDRQIYLASIPGAQLQWRQDEYNSSIGMLLKYHPSEYVIPSEQDYPGFEWNYMWRQTSLALRPLTGHTRGIQMVAWSPDGHILASASSDSTVRIWDVHGNTIAVLKGHKDGVRAVEWSPDGRKLATASLDRTVLVWDTSSWKGLQSFSNRAGDPWVSWCEDSVRLAMPGSDIRQPEVFDSTTGVLIITLQQSHTKWARAIWSPNSKYIATSSVDGTVRIWHPETGKEVSQPVQALSWNTSFSWSRDGYRHSSITDKETIRIVDLITGDNTEITPEKGKPGGVQWSPNGKLLAVLADSSVTIYDSTTLQKHGYSGFNTLHPSGRRETIRKIFWSPNSKLLAATTYEGTVHVWNVEKRVKCDTFPWCQDTDSVSWSYDNYKVATASWSDPTPKVWNISTPDLSANLVLRPSPDSGVLEKFLWQPNGCRIAALYDQRGLVLWDSLSCQEALVPPMEWRSIRGFVWSPDGRWLATKSYKNNDVVIWDPITGKECGRCVGHKDTIVSMDWSPDGSKLATVSGDLSVRIWSPLAGKELHELRGHTDWIYSVAWSPDSQKLFTASTDKTARIWDSVKGDSGKKVVIQGFTQKITFVLWSRDSQHLAVRDEGNVKLLDASSGQNVVTFDDVIVDATLISRSTQGRLAVVPSSNNCIASIYCSGEGFVTNLVGHRGAISRIAWLPNGTRLATSASDGTVRVWDAASGTQLLVYSIDSKNSVWFQDLIWSPDGYLLAVPYSNQIHILNGRPIK